MDAEINNVIYMELNSGPKIANSACGKTIDAKTIDRDSTVLNLDFDVVALQETRLGSGIQKFDNFAIFNSGLESKKT